MAGILPAGPAKRNSAGQGRPGRVMATAARSCQNPAVGKRGFSMERQKIEEAALHLPPAERAQLIRRLVLSLQAPSAVELRSDWLREAAHRAEALDDSSAQAIAGAAVLRKARALIG